MPRSIALLTITLMVMNPTPPQASETAAAALLLDNEDLCLRIGRTRSDVVRSRSDEVAEALARENLVIATEVLDGIPAGSEGASALSVLLDLERRVCGDLAIGDGSVDLESLMRSAADHLEVTIPLDERRRREILARFLDRREEATYRAMAALREEEGKEGPETHGEPEPPVAANWLALDKEAAATSPGTGVAGAPGNRPRRAGIAQASASGGVELSGPTSQQVWDPSPEEMARRRRQKVSAFHGRLDSWRPVIRRELRELATLRSALARELEQRSLQHLRPLCAQLTGTVDRVEYAVVLSAPEASVREGLDRMLAGYATAGRWCASGRFAFAWIEIEKADHRWRELSARLASLGQS